MLRQLRQKKIMKRVLWVLAAIIIPAFVLWGAGSLGDRGKFAGIISGRKISLNEYMSALRAVKNEALMTYGSQFYQFADQLNLEEQAWDRLIMVEEAKRKRVSISDKEVIDFISTMAFFQDKNGSFDQRAYNVILSNTLRQSPREFEEDIRENLIILKLTQDIVKDLSVSKAEIAEALEKEKAAEKERKLSEEKGKKKKETEEPEKTEEDLVKQIERIKQGLLMQKKVQTFQVWQSNLRNRAGLVNFFEDMQEEQKEEEENVTEILPEEPTEIEPPIQEELP